MTPVYQLIDGEEVLVPQTLGIRRGPPPFIEDDGGRSAAGYRGHTGDCACRAAAIASGLPYQEVYDLIISLAERERRPKTGRRGRSHPRTGVHTPTMKRLMETLGAEWTPTMQIGSGCTVHLCAEELPAEGRYVLSLSKHFAAWVDGELHDTYESSRGGSRCVYGYWRFP